MQQWQYTMLRIDMVTRKYSINGVSAELSATQNDLAILDRLGTEGWEMVTALFAHGYDSVSVYLFKRPVPAS